MDMITDLPPVQREHGTAVDAILVVVRPWAFKGGNYRALLEKPLWRKALPKLLLDNLYKRFGLPDSIISDRDPRFAAKSFQELLRLLGVKSKLTTAYHPQGDGTRLSGQ